MTFIIAGAFFVAFGAVLIKFRQAAAAHAERQLSRVLPAAYRPSYQPMVHSGDR
jgi:hypothetical protein